MKKINLVNFDKNLVSLSNSILKYFKVKQLHKSFASLDRVLEKNRNKQIVLFLFDGMGKAILQQHSDVISFLPSGKFFPMTSVFPPTTVAATTALLCGLYPKETGWLGWSQYFSEIDAPVDCFTNINSLNRLEAYSESLIQKHCHYTSIFDLIDAKNKINVTAQLMSIFLPTFPNLTLSSFCQIVQKNIDAKKKFIYAYWIEPDHLMHEVGNAHPIIKTTLADIDLNIKQIVTANPDVLFLVVCDHGHVNVVYDEIEKDNILMETLEKTYFTIEPRAAMFHVKSDQKLAFMKRFSQYYQNYYTLYTREEMLEGDIFGQGIAHAEFKNFVGDFLLVAKSNHAFAQWNNTELVGAHAGMTSAEMEILLYLYNHKESK